MEETTQATSGLGRVAASSFADGQEMAPAMGLALEASFGSVQAWRDELLALAAAHAHEKGMLLTSFDERQACLRNGWLADAARQPEGMVPIFAWPTGRSEAGPVSALERVAWDSVYQRYQDAVHDASEPYGLGREQLGDATLFDVRRAGVFRQADALIRGAQWRDPATVGQWASELPADRPVVVYCVYGHEVGRATALRLRARGLDARFLQEGIAGWQAAGGALQAKDGTG